jgi:hypothetical protein
VKYVIELTDEISNFQEYVTVTKKNGEIIEGIYKMTLMDLLAELQDATEIVEDPIESPVLPSNCIKFVWTNLNRQTSEIYIQVPKRRWDITFYKHRLQQVGFPKMIFKYRVERNKVELSTIVAVKDNGPITLQTPLYHFPFSHVNDSGYVCMGGNTFPKIERIQQLETFHYLFLGSPFTSDYGAKTLTGKPVNMLFQELINTDFPDDWLVPITITEFDETTKRMVTRPATFGSHFGLTTL